MKYLIAGISALAILAGIQTWRIDRIKADVRKAVAERNEARGMLTKSEALRTAESQAASDSYADLSKTCAAGLADALKKGRLIERIVNAPAPATGPRGLIGADSLRDIVGQDPEAGGLPR